MKNRKVPVERNCKYKASSRHSSTASLRSTNHQKRLTKSPFVQNLHKSNTLHNSIENDRKMLPDEMQPPKTKFLSRDRSKEARSTSSPRLKSFPAEKIRKLDNSAMFSPESVGTLIVQQDPRETKTFVNSVARSNNGQGDAISTQFAPFYQPKMHGTSSPSQQEIATNHQQINQANPQSESLLTRQIASPERQAHRPFVPIAQGSIIRDRSPRNPSAMMNQPTTIQNHSTQASQMQQSSSNSHTVVDENHDGTSAFDMYEKQPVGGRNAMNHRQIITQMQQQKQARNVPSANNYYQMHDSFHPNPHQVYQHVQQDAYHPRTLQQPHIQTQSSFKQQQQQQQQQHQQHQQRYNTAGAHCAHYVNGQLSAVQFCGQGMTSPQDMTVSQMKLMQHGLPIHQQSFGYPVNLQASWPQNDRWLQTTTQSRRQVSLQQHPSQCQCHHQIQAAPNVSSDRQSFKNQDRSRSDPSRNPTNQQSVAETQNRPTDKKTLRFTTKMVRDQEMLLLTLRQQGVPDDVVRRQFDALLNEQRRQLAYIAQFQSVPQEEDVELEIRRSHRPTRERTEKDEKPEWMMHITPPRISYYEMERMRAQEKALKKQCPMDDQPVEEMGSSRIQQRNYHPPKPEEMTNQIVPLKQMYFQINPSQITCSHKGAACCSHNHPQNASKNLYFQPNPPLNIQYSYNIPHNPYYPSEQQNIWSEQHDPNLLKSMNDPRVLVEPARFYEQSGKEQLESSSLLQMRLYKEVIRPQKRNNGLQDPESIQKALEALKDPTSKRGLEYLANLTKKKPIVKLNGTQNPNEIPDDLRMRPPDMESFVQLQKKMPANGLENSRNSNNPPPRALRPKRNDEQPAMMEYPRQKRNTGTRYNVQAERENGTVASSQQQDHHAGMVSYMQTAPASSYSLRNASTIHNHCASYPMIYQYSDAPLQHHCQMQQQQQQQQYYLNEGNSVDRNCGHGDVANTQRSDAPSAVRIDRAGGDTGENLNVEETMKRTGIPEMMRGRNGQLEGGEARTIGGVTYLPRKSDYACNNFTVSPDQLIASGHLQPSRIV